MCVVGQTLTVEVALAVAANWRIARAILLLEALHARGAGQPGFRRLLSSEQFSVDGQLNKRSNSSRSINWRSERTE